MLFSRNDHQHHEGQRGKKREQQAETVDPCSESDLKERESEIDRIAAQAIWPRANNGGRGAVAWDGCVRLSERAHCGNEESAGHEHDHDTDRHADWSWEQLY